MLFHFRKTLDNQKIYVDHCQLYLDKNCCQMNIKSITSLLTVLFLILCACSSRHRVDGWYQITDSPDNSVIGKPLITVEDFEKTEIVCDTFTIDGDTITRLLIQGRVKPEKRQQWADGTERLIGKRLGFVFNDSVITAPQINTRIESGSYQINSPDTALIRVIYNSIVK